MKKFKFFSTILVTFALFSTTGNSAASLRDPLTTIKLDTPVHFLAPDGSDLVVKAGTYGIEPAEEWIRLMSGERHDAILIEANKGTHELELPEPLALSVSGTDDDSQDLHHIILLLPNGESLESTGTFSGIRQRGFFKNAVNNVKKKAKQAHKKAKSTAKKAASQAKSSAQKATKQAQQHTQRAASSAKQGLQNSRKAALEVKKAVEKKTRQVVSNVKSGIQKARQTVTGGSGKWTLWSQTAIAAARTEATSWLIQAYIDRNFCKVMAVSAIGTPGVLKSRYSFQGKIAKALKAAGASQTVAEGWDQAFKETWDLWAKNVIIPGLPMYPAFTAFPGAQAPPMPNVPFPLSSMPSAGTKAMTPPLLAKKVLSRLGVPSSDKEAKIAVQGFATDIGGRHATCLGGCQLMNVMGSGPVPSFAPPFVPVGPVIGGSCAGGQIPTPIGY